MVSGSPKVKIRSVILVSLIIVLTCSGISSGKGNEPIAYEKYRELLKVFSSKDDSEAGLLMTQWADYLKTVSTYSIDQYIEALDMLHRDYTVGITQMDQCMGNQDEKQKPYDPIWIDKFVSHFGTEFLRGKEKSIIISLRMAVAGDTENCCGPAMEKLFYKEAVLYGAYRYLLNSFLDFFKSQPSVSKKTLNSRKEAAENFLALINNHSYMKIFIGDDLPRKQLSDIAAKDSADPSIYEYFKENPIGCDIDASKVMEDFRKALRKHE